MNSVTAVKVILFIVILLSLIIVYTTSPDLIAFLPIDTTQFLETIAPLFLISLFIERALEIFLTAWRGGDASGHELTVKLEKKKLAKADKVSANLEDAEKKMSEYKNNTRRIAFLSGLALGILISAFGVRALESFADPDLFDQLSNLQRDSFRLFDTFVTGAVLGGGADGLHKLVSVFTGFLDKTNDNIKAKPTA